MPRLQYKVAEIHCAFLEWFEQMMPGQSILAIDFGEGPEERKETIQEFWKRYVKILQSVERKP